MRRWFHSDLSQIANAPPCITLDAGPMGCVRPDRVNTVLFTGEDGHIHQLHLRGGTWIHTDLSLLANATDATARATTSPTGCVRPDGVFSIVYNGPAGHIHALQIKEDLASHVDLTGLAQAPRSLGTGHRITHFVRGDGVVVVIYISDPSHFRVNQLALSGDNWVHSDLTELTHEQRDLFILNAAGYVRPDHVTSVIFVDVERSFQNNKGIRELALASNGNWTSTNLFNSPLTPHPISFRCPVGFVRGDGKASVLYVGFDEGIHELAFVVGSWIATALSDAANAPKFTTKFGSPAGYVRDDGVTAVVYLGNDDHIHELTLIDGHWLHSDLSVAASAAFGIPFAYVRSDGVSSIVYVASDKHIHELALLPA